MKSSRTTRTNRRYVSKARSPKCTPGLRVPSDNPRRIDRALKPQVANSDKVSRDHKENCIKMTPEWQIDCSVVAPQLKVEIMSHNCGESATRRQAAVHGLT